MKVVKYILIFQLLGALASIIKFLTTPLEEMVTIQLSLFYLLMAWSIFGIMYITEIIAKDRYNIMKK